jgi:tetratricopeptide (TPR) repeat protein
VPVALWAQLLDRLATVDEASFVATWIESTVGSRARPEPPLVVRLLRAYREMAAFDKARELAAALPSAPSSWNPLDVARLSTERALLALVEGRCDRAEAELRLATRTLAAGPRGSGLREQLEVHLAQAQVDIRGDRPTNAATALRLAEHMASRLDEGPWIITASMTLGHLAMCLAEPRQAVKHHLAALARAPSEGMSAMNAHANIAIALASLGRCVEARRHASKALRIAAVAAPGAHHADVYDVLASVELAADRPAEALFALDEAAATLGDVVQPTLRWSLALHRTQSFCMQGQHEAAGQSLERTERLVAECGPLDALDEQDVCAVRARVLEVRGLFQEALGYALTRIERLPEAFSTCALNLVVGRSALALNDAEGARAAVERVALVADRHGWAFPDRTLTKPLWEVALKSGDSRVVRYAERVLCLADIAEVDDDPTTTFQAPGQSNVHVAALSPLDDGPSPSEDKSSSTLIYVTTPDGVTRVAHRDLAHVTRNATLVVDTLAHHLRVHDREVSLERRRAIEPLVVQLLRRAKEGLSADEVLRAAGGPGPESADAEHRVRVLISRVRDILRDPSAVERIRDAGEYGRTRYRIAPTVRFALVEPLFSNN